MRALLAWLSLVACTVPAAAATYYVSATGNDAASGGSPATAWRTIARVNAVTLAPGDRVRFQGGSRFAGTLELGAGEGGTPTAPVTFDSYGTGRATLDGRAGTAVRIYDAAGIVLSNLFVVGSGRTSNNGSGIDLFADLPGDVKLRYVRIQNVEVANFGNHGIAIGGWNGASGFADVAITATTVHDNGRTGIVTYGPPFDPAAPAWANEDVYVGRVRAYRNPGVPTDLGRSSGSGVTLGGVRRATVELSVAHDNGALCRASGCGAGIWAYDSTEVTIQLNESHHNRTGGPADGDGFDLDQNTSRSLVQYCYAHDNDGAGLLLYSGASGAGHAANTVRWNISQNDGRRNGFGGLMGGGSIYGDAIYDNTVYVSATPAGVPAPVAALFPSVGSGVTVRNNIFQVGAGVRMVEAPALAPDALVFQQNDYYAPPGALDVAWGLAVYSTLAEWRAATGQEQLGATATGLDVDPRLVRPGGGGTLNDASRLGYLGAYRLRSDSPLLGIGLDLPALFGIDTGGRDFYGTPVPSGNGPDVGAAESS